MSFNLLVSLNVLLDDVSRIYGAHSAPTGPLPTAKMRTTADAEVYEAPGIQLYVAAVYVHLPELRTREAELLRILGKLPEVKAALTSEHPDQTTYVHLGALLGDQGRALRVMACLIALERAELMTIGTVLKHAGLSEEAVYEAAGQGYLSLIGVNLELERAPRPVIV